MTLSQDTVFVGITAASPLKRSMVHGLSQPKLMAPIPSEEGPGEALPNCLRHNIAGHSSLREGTSLPQFHFDYCCAPQIVAIWGGGRGHNCITSDKPEPRWRDQASEIRCFKLIQH